MGDMRTHFLEMMLVDGEQQIHSKVVLKVMQVMLEMLEKTLGLQMIKMVLETWLVEEHQTHGLIMVILQMLEVLIVVQEVKDQSVVRGRALVVQDQMTDVQQRLQCVLSMDTVSVKLTNQEDLNVDLDLVEELHLIRGLIMLDKQPVLLM